MNRQRRRRNRLVKRAVLILCFFVLIITGISLLMRTTTSAKNDDSNTVKTIKTGDQGITGLDEQNDLDMDVSVSFIDSDIVYVFSDEEYPEIYQVEGQGNYTVTMEPSWSNLTDGNHTVKIIVTDEEGNSQTVSKNFDFEFIAYDVTEKFSGMNAEDVFFSYFAEKGLETSSINFFYYNTYTEEEYVYHGDTVFYAASAVKLPLAMAYYDLFHEGIITKEDTLYFSASSYASGDGNTVYDYSIGEYVPIGYLLEQSITYSDNTATYILIDGYYQLTGTSFQRAIANYGTTPLDSSFYDTWALSASYALDVVRLAYYQENYQEILDDMKAANPGQYMKRNNTTYEIAHKYGDWDNCVHDYGIVYTPSPYFIGIFTQYQNNPETIISELTTLFTEYTLYQLKYSSYQENSSDSNTNTDTDIIQDVSEEVSDITLNEDNSELLYQDEQADRE